MVQNIVQAFEGAAKDYGPVGMADRLDDWHGKRVEFPRSATLPQMFRACVTLYPDKIAIYDGDMAFRYAELGHRVDAIARRLQARGVVAGDTVGIGLERSVTMVAAMLATMQLGAAYVPLDPSNPPERLTYIAQDADLACIVSDIVTAKKLGFAQALTLDDLDAAEIANSRPLADAVIDPMSMAYIAYTSGSTGKPKGVMGTHRAAVNRFGWMWRDFPFSTDEVLCQKTAISFVDSVWEIFGPLLAGVPQVIIGTATVLEPKDFLAALARHRVTRLLVVPSLLKTLLGAKINLNVAVPSLRMVFCSGEVLSAPLARQFLNVAPDVQLINLYGSSEVAADVTCEVIRQVDGDAVSIGRPIDNARIYILDRDHNPVPAGETGELFVGGEVLAAGYLNRPDLTAERFLKDPFVTGPDARMFATGDLVCQLADGRLMFKGRTDDQVKIRGARVELGEVELALASLPDVAEAAVVASTGDDDDVTLYAYLLAKDGTAPQPDVLRAMLARQLPSYMVPTYLTILDRMPLNPNGKIDRVALGALGFAPPAFQVDDTSMDASAQDMLKIWGRLIAKDRIGLDDDFFVIGGHSLMAVKLFSQIRQMFGVELPIAALLEHPTPRRLLQRVKEATDTAALARGAFSGVPENAPWDTTAVIHPGPATGATALFIAGGVGGNVNNLFEFGKFIGRHRPLIGLQTRGVLGHRMHDTVEATAADHIVNIRHRQPKGPYLLAGYSGGVFAAYEMARQLQEAGETVAFLGILDMTAPNFENSLSYPFADRIQYQARMLRQYGLSPLWANTTRWLGNTLNPRFVVRLGYWIWPEMFRYRRISQHWLKLSGTYLPGPYDSDAWLYLTNSETDGFTAEQMRKVDPLFGWPRLLKGRLKVHQLDSDHLGMVSGENGRILADTMEDDIKTAVRAE